MIPAPFEYHSPSTLREAVTILRRYPGDARVLAGGHSLLPMMKLRLARPAHVVDLGGVQGLAYITDRDGALAIGSMTTYYMLESSSLVQKRAQALSDAASLVADLQVRNKGSIGGSLAHADPAADLPAVALALEARIKTIGGGRARNLPAGRFFVDVFTTSPQRLGNHHRDRGPTASSQYRFCLPEVRQPGFSFRGDRGCGRRDSGQARCLRPRSHRCHRRRTPGGESQSDGTLPDRQRTHRPESGAGCQKVHFRD